MIETRLTKALGIEHPVISAPMAKVGGGKLAAAVTHAGGLGLIGGGYVEPDWIDAQLTAAGNAPVGIGFITWRLNEAPQQLQAALDRNVSAVFLSFGDPMPYGKAVLDAGSRLICQCQSLDHVRRAIDAGASIIVAQGREAGGHGANRATMTLVPEVADLLAREAPEVLLCAAGGIADGRGLSAALMLGADGAVCGSRFWASAEALLPPGHLDAGIAATGDDTMHTQVIDVARDFEWPAEYRNRVLRTPFVEKWHGDIAGLAADEAAKADWVAALGEGRTDVASATVGEAVGLIRSSAPAGELLRGMVQEAAHLLDGGWRR